LTELLIVELLLNTTVSSIALGLYLCNSSSEHFTSQWRHSKQKLWYFQLKTKSN